MPRARVPGLPDEAFRSDGMLTRREVRAATLARLVPLPGQCLWDVGAGSGAVAIEWLRATRRGRAVAIERDAARCALIRANAAALGTPGARARGRAPHRPRSPACRRRMRSSSAAAAARRACSMPAGRRWRRAGGWSPTWSRVEGERALLDWQARHGGELVRIEVARLAAIGRLHAWRPALPVTQLAACKP